MYEDSFSAENAALNRKLQSKAEALAILTRELNKCRKERDNYQELLELEKLSKQEYSSLPKQKNSELEIDDLKRKLRATQAELKEVKKAYQNNHEWQEKEVLVNELEDTKSRLKELSLDLQVLLDEKEELVTERDAFRCKVHRLNHQLSVLLKSNSPFDIDALVMENKYLKDRHEQAVAEKEMIQQSLIKYKTMLDKKRMKGSVKLGGNTCGGLVVTHKQGKKNTILSDSYGFNLNELNIFTVQELLKNDGSVWKNPYNAEATLADLRSLSLALLEALQDKTMALSHQRKTNKILADRVTTLEDRLAKDEAIFPSQQLLNGYTRTELDKDLNTAIINEFKEIKISKRKASNDDEEGEAKTMDTCDGLTPELQELVLKAMEEINYNSSVCG